VLNPVTAVLPGRRNNPPEPGIRPLAVFNPIHYLELPELFMEFICSMTGKSPSTTGAGSEGASPRAPSTPLPPSLISTTPWSRSSSPATTRSSPPRATSDRKFRVDHDISLIVPEIWCRMGFEEATPAHLIAHGCLERCRDLDVGGRRVLASRLGWRINERFAIRYCGRIFNHPHLVFSEEMLRPELQDPEIFADGMENIVATHQHIARGYFDDGSIHLACPPLQALLHIMKDGSWEGRDLQHPEVRALFSRPNLIRSDWYLERLKSQQQQDEQLAARHVDTLQKFLMRTQYADEAVRLKIADRLKRAQDQLATARSPGYTQALVGFLGRQPRFRLPEPAKD
jgi:hypothetical protein